MGTWLTEFHQQAQSWLSDLQCLDNEYTESELQEQSGPENKHAIACTAALFKLLVSMCTARRFQVKRTILTDLTTTTDVTLDECLRSKSLQCEFAPSNKPLITAPGSSPPPPVLYRTESGATVVSTERGGTNGAAGKKHPPGAGSGEATAVKARAPGAKSGRKSPRPSPPAADRKASKYADGGVLNALRAEKAGATKRRPAPGGAQTAGAGGPGGSGEPAHAGDVSTPSAAITSKFPLLSETIAQLSAPPPDIIQQAISKAPWAKYALVHSPLYRRGVKGKPGAAGAKRGGRAGSAGGAAASEKRSHGDRGGRAKRRAALRASEQFVKKIAGRRGSGPTSTA